MQLEIIQDGRVLRQYNHENRLYAEAPPQGAYEIRLTNNCPRRRLAVAAVDGVNVVTGENASVDDPGYVLRPWESLTIKGWRRDDKTVAKFTFQPQEGSYAARTGRGTKNTGVIGIAVYDEKVNPIFRMIRETTTRTFERIDDGTLYSERLGTTNDSFGGGPTVVNAVHDGSAPTLTATAAAMPASASSLSFGEDVDAAPRHADTRSTTAKGRLAQGLESKERHGVLRRRRRETAEPVQLGTGYGKEVTMHTETTTFDRATSSPVLTIQVQYAVREQLIKWGVPVYEEPPKPEAFPAGPSVPPPPGWQASR
jgi:hypothetical protein